MVNDFPDDERKPLMTISARYQKKQNLCVLYEEDGLVKGYGILEFCEECRCLLMDYFAVFPEYRKQGVGTRFLREMKAYFGQWDALLIESECAHDETSQRRLDFYVHQGALLSGVRIQLYHVDYEILAFSLAREVHAEEVRDLLKSVYRKIYPKSFQKLFLKWY